MAKKRLKKGSIVLVSYPFSDLASVKARPALILTPDKILAKIDDAIFLFISSVYPSDLLPSDFILEKAHSSFAKTGLKSRSVFRAHKLSFLHKSLVLRLLGEADENLLKIIDEKLRIALALNSTEILNPQTEQYLDDLMPADSVVLQEMEARAKERNFPIIRPVVGRLLWQYAKAIGAKRIFELGSGFGYSALWFAKALPADGEIFCTDFSQENLDRIKVDFVRENVQAGLHTLHGDALAHLEKTGGEFDIILMDIDKQDYVNGFKLAWPKVRRGGLMITDNALWHGRVVEEDPDKTTQAVLDFTKLAFSQKDAISMLIPLRDGVIVSLKI